jgi:hypothetical protein
MRLRRAPYTSRIGARSGKFNVSAGNPAEGNDGKELRLQGMEQGRPLRLNYLTASSAEKATRSGLDTGVLITLQPINEGVVTQNGTWQE